MAVSLGIPTPAFSSALAFYDGYRSSWLPANLLQVTATTHSTTTSTTTTTTTRTTKIHTITNLVGVPGAVE